MSIGMTVRFVGGPLDGQLCTLAGHWRPGQLYAVPYMERPYGESTELFYEMRADHYGPADLVGVLIEAVPA